MWKSAQNARARALLEESWEMGVKSPCRPPSDGEGLARIPRIAFLRWVDLTTLARVDGRRRSLAEAGEVLA